MKIIKKHFKLFSHVLAEYDSRTQFLSTGNLGDDSEKYTITLWISKIYTRHSNELQNIHCWTVRPRSECSPTGTKWNPKRCRVNFAQSLHWSEPFYHIDITEKFRKLLIYMKATNK